MAYIQSKNGRQDSIQRNKSAATCNGRGTRRDNVLKGGGHGKEEKAKCRA